MQIIITENYNEMSEKAADIFCGVLKKPNAVLGLATGSTPIGLYKLLVERCRAGLISFKDVRTVNLDEYVGLGKEDEQSYVWFMNKMLFDGVDIDKANTHLPNGLAADVAAECARYSALVNSLHRDIQLLGLGGNGHIGFNEPGTPFDSLTHEVALTMNTIMDNSRLFARAEDVPRRAITMGIGEIMQAGSVLLLASGGAKAKAVKELVKGPVCCDCPASILQTHPNCTLVLDRAAAAML